MPFINGKFYLNPAYGKALSLNGNPSPRGGLRSPARASFHEIFQPSGEFK